MAAPRRPALTVIILGAMGLTSFVLVAAQHSRASAQDAAAKEREAKARAQDAAVQEAAAAHLRAAQAAKEAAAKKAAAKAQAEQEAEAKAAAARAAAAAKGEPVALDLTKYVVIKPAQFKRFKQYPWAVTPLGKQTFAGVQLEIQGATILFGKRNNEQGQTYPKKHTGIPVQMKFETLYILHCVFFEAAEGEPSFYTVINFEGGKKQSDEILCGEDSKDWWVNDPKEELGPSSKRSTLARKGTGKANGRDQDVRFCLTAIDNLHPDSLVTTIDLVSSEKQAAGVILAITLGKSGLLKPQPDKAITPNEPKDE